MYNGYLNCIGGSDYSVLTGPASLKTLTSTNQKTTYAVTIISDGIVLEEEETFNLQLQQTSGQQPVISFHNTTITIVDGDGRKRNSHMSNSYTNVSIFYRFDWSGML